MNTPLTRKEVKKLSYGFNPSKFPNRKKRREILQKPKYNGLVKRIQFVHGIFDTIEREFVKNKDLEKLSDKQKNKCVIKVKRILHFTETKS